MTGAVFCHVQMDDLASLIRRARQLAIIAAPGIDEGVASALVLAAEAIGKENVRVILDVNEENCRVGYGNVDGYSTLIEKGIPVRQCPGLRIGFAIVDNEGFIFGQPPLMVEAPAKLHGCPNAIRATPEQIRALEAASRPPLDATIGPTKLHPTQPLASRNDRGIAPEIGQTCIGKAEVKRIEENIRANPVQNFDLSRIVRVFNAHVQFATLSVEGTNLETHTVKLPPELLTVVRSKETRDRIRTAFKVVSENSKISGDKIRKAANEIRKRYIRTHPVYGGVILKAKKAALEQEIGELRQQVEKHKEAVRDQYLKETQKSKRELVQAFWRAIRTSPPSELLAEIPGEKPSTEVAKAYLADKLDRVLPDVERLCDNMRVTFVTMDVTWETLTSPNFAEWLAEQFRFNAELKHPFQDYYAARQRPDVLSQMSRQNSERM